MEDASITWLGQGGYLLRYGQASLMIDPYLSNALFEAKGRSPGFDRMVPPPFLPDVLAADAVVVTHPHIDHLDEKTLLPAQSRIQRFIGPSSCVDALCAMGIPAGKVHCLNRGEHTQVQSMHITATYAAHTEDSIGALVGLGECRLYFVGDSLLDERMLASPPRVDMLFCCINGRLGNMDVWEAATLARAINTRVAIPCHYGLFPANTENPARFVEALSGSGISVRILNVGKSYSLHELWKG